MRFVYQDKDSNHCVLACLATLMDIPMCKMKSICDELEIDYNNGVTTWDEARIIQYCGWENNIVYVSNLTQHAVFNRTYLATVPSLNHAGGTHRIVFKCIPGDGSAVGKFLIHDPNRLGIRYGVDVLVTSWSELTEFLGEYVWPEEVE